MLKLIWEKEDESGQWLAADGLLGVNDELYNGAWGWFGSWDDEGMIIGSRSWATMEEAMLDAEKAFGRWLIE